ncbi:MAG: hypothetical protein DHS20C15_15500 [Planctomycetota bacterium]|nr:MAG: hypothetical protein DHS20C15_15500 [Planctomycetota bacterium]
MNTVSVSRRPSLYWLVGALVGVVVLDLMMATVPDSGPARSSFRLWAGVLWVIALLGVVFSARHARGAAVPPSAVPDEAQLLRLHAESLAAAFGPALVHDGNNALLSLRFQLAELARLHHGDSAADALVTGLERDMGVMEELMRRMRALSRVHDEDQMRSLDMVSVLHGIEDGLRTHLRTRACDLRLELPQEVLLAADRRRLEQALLGLALHAVERCGEGGNVLLRAHVDGPKVTIEVHDDGMIPHPDEFNAGREPFITSAEDLTGLQMWACRACARRHHGSLQLEASELGGLCRRLVLPRDLALDIQPDARVDVGGRVAVAETI